MKNRHLPFLPGFISPSWSIQYSRISISTFPLKSRTLTYLIFPILKTNKQKKTYKQYNIQYIQCGNAVSSKAKHICHYISVRSFTWNMLSFLLLLLPLDADDTFEVSPLFCFFDGFSGVVCFFLLAWNTEFYIVLKTITGTLDAGGASKHGLTHRGTCGPDAEHKFQHDASVLTVKNWDVRSK